MMNRRRVIRTEQSRHENAYGPSHSVTVSVQRPLVRHPHRFEIICHAANEFASRTNIKTMLIRELEEIHDNRFCAYSTFKLLTNGDEPFPSDVGRELAIISQIVHIPAETIQPSTRGKGMAA